MSPSQSGASPMTPRLDAMPPEMEYSIDDIPFLLTEVERLRGALRVVADHLDEALLPQDWACTECLAELGQEPLADPFHCWYHRLVALLRDPEATT